MADLAWSTPVSCVTVSMRGTRAAQRGHALCRLDRIFKHQLSELMFDDDCRRKLDFSSEPVRTHWPLLWPSILTYAWRVPANCDRCTPALAVS